MINDSKSVIIFNRQGKYLRSIPLEKGSMDIVGDILYTYQFLNKEICAYTLKGDKLWRNLLNYPNEAGYMGDYFVSITPNLFAVANMSIGYNHYELLFLIRKEKLLILGKIDVFSKNNRLIHIIVYGNDYYLEDTTVSIIILF